MTNGMEVRAGQEIEVEFNSEMKNFANVINGEVFDYFYINSARWDTDEQRMYIIVNVLPSNSEALTEAGHLKYIKFESKYRMDYFSAQVNKDKQKLDELSIVFREEHESDIKQDVYKFMLDKFNEVKTITNSSNSALSVKIDFEDVELFEVGKF